ncbi:glycine-rich domain-containing protein 1 isoform X2 [Vigna angularis]|uniref:glycine-rich domain-containing protein 1 isoform X2 n=1 Tax=Phaseolus angularis TaxID=3914 RepID=UPI0022B36591|nr:glycine-rich domain-containing protein 1 isoform X2 [Vigna angularis]
MDTQQELEWAEAQKIVLSENLVATAKQQLLFLAEVDRNRDLYDDGPLLRIAVYRYKYCWLPLLAKHTESPVTEIPLVVPLDCEWIWHCHRLNPVRYKTDCIELYGRILGNSKVLSSTQGTSKEESEKVWDSMYPSEPYELVGLNNHSLQGFAENFLEAKQSTTNYDLISAVKRQTTFFYQVSRPYWKVDTFLEGAVARYKGFLHLIKRNRERHISRFSVPTYDIDLIWHSHQLHPVSYCNDLVAIMGKVLEHDDTDSNRTKGQKLDVGFSETTRQWEETFGSRYWKAGAMYRGNPPSPLPVDKYKIVGTHQFCSAPSSNTNQNQNLIQLPQKLLVQVMLEFVDVRNFPSEHKGKLLVSFNKKQEDVLFNTKKQLSISSKSQGKQVAVFQCESNGELLLELISRPSFNFRGLKLHKVLGKTSINLEDLQNVASKLPIEKWNLSTENTKSSINKKVIGRTASGNTHLLAELKGTVWSMMNSNWVLQIKKTGDEDKRLFELFELTGTRNVVIFPGRKLEYETRNYGNGEESRLMTAVKFSPKYPYGKAVALMDLEYGFLEIKEEWLVLPAILSAFILSNFPEFSNESKEENGT